MSWSFMYIHKMLLNARKIAVLTVPPGWLISLLKLQWTDSWSTWRQEWIELPKETKSNFFSISSDDLQKPQQTNIVNNFYFVIA